MQLGPGARTSLAMAARSRRQRTKRRRTSAGGSFSTRARKAALWRSSSRCRSSPTAPAAPRVRRALDPPRKLPQLQPELPSMLRSAAPRPAPSGSSREPAPCRCRRPSAHTQDSRCQATRAQRLEQPEASGASGHSPGGCGGSTCDSDSKLKLRLVSVAPGG